MSKEFNVQEILELACAAQRVNGRYIKEVETLFATDNKISAYIFDNKSLISFTLGELSWTGDNAPFRLTITNEDKELVKEIRQFYKRLAFVVMADPDNSYFSEVMTLLHSTTMPKNKIGFIASLPGVYERDKVNSTLKKQAKSCEEGFLGNIGEVLYDLDSEIIQVIKSKNYEGWNIVAIVDNKGTSWFSKERLELGPCVIVKARISDHTKHWKYDFDTTRLNYVKAAQ